MRQRRIWTFLFHCLRSIKLYIAIVIILIFISLAARYRTNSYVYVVEKEKEIESPPPPAPVQCFEITPIPDLLSKRQPKRDPITVKLLARTIGTDGGMFPTPWRDFRNTAICERDMYKCRPVIIENSCSRKNVRCELHYNMNDESAADAILFHPRFTRDYDVEKLIRWKSRSYQFWVLHTVETPLSDDKHRYWMNSTFDDHVATRYFNFTSSYRLDSDFPFTYIPRSLEFLTYRQLGKFPIPTKEKKKGSVFWLAGNCDSTSGRENYVADLSRYIQIDSYGGCNRNMNYNINEHSYEEVLRLMSQYKFNLVLENSLCKDWITERYWRTLELGIVPIVRGPLNLQRFMPTNHSVIDALDMHPMELAQLIEEIDSNDTLYEQYLDFHKDPSLIQQSFRDLWNPKNNYHCGYAGLCNRIADIRQGVENFVQPPPYHFFDRESCIEPYRARVGD